MPNPIEDLPAPIRHAVQGMKVIVVDRPHRLRSRQVEDVKLLAAAEVPTEKVTTAAGIQSITFQSGGRLDYISSGTPWALRGRRADFVAGDLSLDQAYFLTINSSLPDGQRF